MKKYKYILLYKKVKYEYEANHINLDTITNHLTLMNEFSTVNKIVASFPVNKVVILRIDEIE